MAHRRHIDYRRLSARDWKRGSAGVSLPFLAFVSTFALVLSGTVALSPVVSAQGSSNAPSSDFYRPPAELPAENGALIRSEPMPLLLSIPALPGVPGSSAGAGTWPGDGYRIMYRSIGSKGQPIAVTGTYLQPRAAWTGGGKRPLAVVAPGTQGQSDNCAPSKSFQTGLTVQTDPPSMAASYEYLSAYAMLSRGYGVVITDYEGLGTPGLHSYAHREASARAVLDAARAATHLAQSDVRPGTRTVFTGYSQGGGAVAAAAELQPDYARDINLVGTVAGSPPANLLPVLQHIDGTAIAGAIGYALNSLADAYPQVEERLAVLLNEKGQQMRRAVAGQCIPESIVQFGFQRTNSFTKSGRPAADLVREDPVALSYLEKQRIGRLRPTSPIQIVSPLNDDIVEPTQSRQLGRDWCTLGASVNMRIDSTPSIAPGFALNHGWPMVSRLGETAQYLADRVEGLSPPVNCGTY